jgi:beta-galactosidase
MGVKSYLKIVPFSFLIFVFLCQCTNASLKIRSIENFCKNWKFHLGDINNTEKYDFDDSNWRMFNLPHDWN